MEVQWKYGRRFSRAIWLALCLTTALSIAPIIVAPRALTAEEPYSAAYNANIPLNTPRATDSIGALHAENLTILPLNLGAGSSLTMIAPDAWESIAQRIAKIVERVHGEYQVLFEDPPPLAASVRLLERGAFLRRTGAPSWTNALYYRGEIMIPLSIGEKIDPLELIRSVRHEYLHAVVHALSGGKCPGWLDEGLAQWLEGDENPALSTALSKWLAYRSPLPLSLLQGGFTKLHNDMVPAAYAQSLFAARVVIERFGFSRVRSYLVALREGATKSEAFISSFGMSEDAFERTLAITLHAWQNESSASLR